MSQASSNSANNSQTGSLDPEIELNLEQTPERNNGPAVTAQDEEVTQSQQDSWVVDDLPEEALQPPTAEEMVELQRIQVLLAEQQKQEQELIAQRMADQAREAGMIAPREVPSSNAQLLNQGHNANQRTNAQQSSSFENQARTTATPSDQTQRHGSNSGPDSQQRPITLHTLVEMAKNLSAEEQAQFVNLAGWHARVMSTQQAAVGSSFVPPKPPTKDNPIDLTDADGDTNMGQPEKPRPKHGFSFKTPQWNREPPAKSTPVVQAGDFLGVTR